MKLKIQNPHLPLGAMLKMRKEDLLAAIRGYATMDYRKETLIDILNNELNRNPDMEVKP